MNINWEDSRQKYYNLFTSLDKLIHETTESLADYEQINVVFAYQMYNEDLLDLVTKEGCFDNYSEEFRTIHQSLKKQIRHLQAFKEKMELLMLKDDTNCSVN